MNAADLIDESPIVIDASELAPRKEWPPVRLMLASGYHTRGDLLSWMYVGKEIRTTWRVERALLHPFTEAGAFVALTCARGLRDEMSPNSNVFLMRVVVTGDPAMPDEVVEAWRLESPKPVPLKFPFDQ